MDGFRNSVELVGNAVMPVFGSYMFKTKQNCISNLR